MQVLYIIIALASVFLFLQKKYVTYLVLLMALMTNGFMLLPSAASSLRGSDAALFATIAIIILSSIGGQNIVRINDKYSKYVVVVTCFLLFEGFITVVSGADSISYVVKVLRIPLLIILFYIIRSIPINKIKKFLRIAFFITVFDSVLYLLEFVGIDTLPDVDPMRNLSSFGFSSSTSIPIFTFVFLISTLSKDIIKKFRFGFMALFLMVLTLTFVRTYILGFIISAAVYLFLQKTDKKLFFKYAIIAVLIYPLLNIAFNMKDNASGHEAKGDLETVISGDIFSPEKNLNASNGTFAFRLAMLIERWQYLVKHPEYLLTGVGAIHEDSPKCYTRFNFILGTRNEGRHGGRCQIESGDNTWVPITLRYGLIGTIIYLYFFWLVFNGARRRHDALVIIAPIILFYFFTSLSGSFFEKANCYLVICLTLALLSRAEAEKYFVKNF